MQKFIAIKDVYAREILDSRGNPTIEVEVLAEGDIVRRRQRHCICRCISILAERLPIRCRCQ